MMRAALGRCFEQPIPLDDLEAGYAKAIARAYDTHWYRFTAPVSGTYSIRTHSRVNTVGYLLDETGRQLAVFGRPLQQLLPGFSHRVPAGGGEELCPPGERPGQRDRPVRPGIAVPQEGQVLPESCSVDQERVSLQEGSRCPWAIRCSPRGPWTTWSG